VVRPTDELSLAQHSLSRALGRARAGEDRELAQKVREGGESLAQLLAGLLKMSRVHAADNRAFDAPVEGFQRSLALLVELLGPVHLAAVEDQVYVNEVRVRTDGKGSAKDLGAELAKHNVGGLTFHSVLDAAAVRALVSGFAEKPAEVSPRRTLQELLSGRAVGSVELAPRYRFRTQDEVGEHQSPEAALKRALSLVDETYDNLSAGRVLNPLPLRRAVVDLLAVGAEAPELWEGLGQGSPHARHASTVALLSILVGRAAGLSGGVLQDLGLAALLHDVGYVALPKASAPGPEGLMNHPSEGARLMLRQRGYHEGKLRRLRAVLDHHRDHVEPRGRPSVLGQILRLAEDYATLVRVYEGRISPADALGAMAQASGRAYHPVLTQILVNVLGRYPPGTLLELEDGRYARSVSPTRSPETFATPLVRVYDLKTRALADRLDLARGVGVRRALPG
jgi:hypothetical protein